MHLGSTGTTAFSSRLQPEERRAQTPSRCRPIGASPRAAERSRLLPLSHRARRPGRANWLDRFAPPPAVSCGQPRPPLRAMRHAGRHEEAALFGRTKKRGGSVRKPRGRRTGAGALRELLGSPHCDGAASARRRAAKRPESRPNRFGYASVRNWWEAVVRGCLDRVGFAPDHDV